MDPSKQSRLVRDLARGAGFDSAGIAVAESLDPGPEGDRFREWIAGGRHGSMDYMARDPGRRLDPAAVLPGCRSILCVALNYGKEPKSSLPGNRGDVAAYALGRDYHKVFTRRLKVLETSLRDAFPGVRTRRYVDTGPVLEKLWAERAGLGWRGKHTNLLSREWGSWLLLGEILLDLELEPDEPGEDFCGECTRCIDVCPTGAIAGPYRLDARRCISYLTIEHRGSIPEELRPLLGSHVFGCDECLDVCPWNRFSRLGTEPDFNTRPEVVAPLLFELVTMTEDGFRDRFAGTAVMRAKREGLARNACVALGNAARDPKAEDALREEARIVLTRALEDESQVVREHAAWALDRLGSLRG